MKKYYEKMIETIENDLQEKLKCCSLEEIQMYGRCIIKNNIYHYYFKECLIGVYDFNPKFNI